MKILNWFIKKEVTQTVKYKTKIWSSSTKNNFIYTLFHERNSIVVEDHVYFRPSLILSSEEEKILSKISKFYFLKDKDISPVRVFRVKFKNKTFDILNQGKLYQIYEPTSDSLRLNFDEYGNHTGVIIDSDLFESYIGLAFNIIANELEKSIFGDDPINLIFQHDQDENVVSIESTWFILED